MFEKLIAFVLGLVCLTCAFTVMTMFVSIICNLGWDWQHVMRTWFWIFIVLEVLFWIGGGLSQFD